MNLNLKCTLIILLIVLIFSRPVDAKIIPSPKQITYTSGTFTIPTTTTLSLVNDKIAQNLYAAEIINTTLWKKFNIHTYLEVNPENAQILLVLIDENRAKSYGIPEDKLQESYRISISQESIVIEAPFPQGIFYGAMSLEQLIEQAPEPNIENQIIVDWADYAIRGISDDLSHGQLHTVKGFKDMIRYMARYKMNTYLWYVEDILLIDKFASITRNRDVLTKNEVQQIVLFGQKHFIDIIPVFSTLGHHETILANDQFQNLAEFPGSNVLCPTCPGVYLYLEDVLKEISELFPSQFIHIGGEASKEISYGKSAAQVKENGLAESHSDHFQKVYDICKKFNKKVMMFQDLIQTFPRLSELLPSDIIYTNRRDHLSKNQGTYNHGIASNNQGESQLPFYVSSSIYNNETTFPLYSETISGIREVAETGLKDNSTGIIIANWGEQGSETFKELFYYGYTWTAQCAWNLKKSRKEEFDRQFFVEFFECDNPVLEKIYQQLSNPVNIVAWDELWRHPLLPFPTMPTWYPDISPIERAETLEENMNQVLKDLDSLEFKVEAHAEHIDVLRVVALMNKYYADKIKVQISLHAQMKERQEEQGELITQIEKNIVDLQALQKAYENTWTKFYHPESLKYISSQFKRLTYYLQESLDGLLPNSELSLPLLKSKWIYDCEIKGDTSDCASETLFRKDFNLDKIPNIANLQVIADSYAEIVINGKEVDQIFVRGRRNLFLEDKSIKIFNIQNYLIEGNNTILVKVANYSREQDGQKNSVQHGAGLNVSALIKVGLKEIKLQTDASWLAQDAQSEGNNSWNEVTVREYPKKIISPNFLIGRTSRVEP